MLGFKDAILAISNALFFKLLLHHEVSEKKSITAFLKYYDSAIFNFVLMCFSLCQIQDL